MTTSTAHMRRRGRSVHSTHQAASVPITAQRIVTTTVRRIVFHTSVQVSGRQIRSQTVDQLESRASSSRNTRGAASTTATARLNANRIHAGARRRAATTGPGPAVA